MTRHPPQSKTGKMVHQGDLCDSLVCQTAAAAQDEKPKQRVATPPAVSRLSAGKLIPFGWYGGKFSHLDWLLPLLPLCHHYCEPFAGSAAVLLNRPSSPVETYNDLDGEVVSFFRVLRDEKERLVEGIRLTQFSREEFAISSEVSQGSPPMERARRLYIRARRVLTRLAKTGSSQIQPTGAQLTAS